MQTLIEVVLPVFLVIGFGYVAVWRRWFSDTAVDGLMTFAQKFALPCLLFMAIWSLDLSQEFDIRLLLSFYAGALAGFATGLLGARHIFGRDWQDSVAIGFCGLFSNSLMLGLVLTERAFGPEALTANYVIIAIHAPFCYCIGITAMEIVRAQGTDARALPGKVFRAMFRNALVIGILLGALANLSGLPLPGAVTSAMDLMVRAALPAALFGMGGVLYRYKPQGDFRIIAFVCAISLVLHPAVTWSLGALNQLSTDTFRSAVVTSAMAPGINAYLFANMYGRATRIAASSVLIATALSVLTASAWLSVLP